MANGHGPSIVLKRALLNRAKERDWALFFVRVMKKK